MMMMMIMIRFLMTMLTTMPMYVDDGIVVVVDVWRRCTRVMMLWSHHV